MKILVFNAGSSSLKFGVFDLEHDDSRVFKGEFERFAESGCTLHFRDGGESAAEQERRHPAVSVAAAIESIPALLTEFGQAAFDAIGHRVAHGGDRFHESAVIDDEVLSHIESMTPLAPLHNPANLKAIALARSLWPSLPQVAVFDTAFHHSIPPHASTYAIPKAWRDKGVRRYGFHGTSHHYVALRVASELKTSVNDLQIISCHLGNGASICAINRGFSVDTSMGMTPLEGLVMGTRSGDVDPGLFAYLGREMNLSASEIETALYSESGLLALAGTSDMRDVESNAARGDQDAQLAIRLYAYRVRKYIGAYAAAMGGVDVIAFTGGIGEHSATMRRRICDRLNFLGLELDEDKNQAVSLTGFEAPQIQAIGSRIRVLVTQTAEQLMIAQETRHALERGHIKEHHFIIPVAVSARHVHLSQAHVEALFGPGHQLTLMKKLNQPEGWAAEETVEVIGPKGAFPKVRVLGPTRSRTQIEVSRTDTFTLGVEAPLRPSGKLDNTPKVTLRGPKGQIETDGLIVAARHVHMNSVDAARMGLQDGDYVDMHVGEGARGVLFAHTMIRVKDDYYTEMHIDTDEANAAGIITASEGELIINDTREEGAIVSRRKMKLAAG